MRALKIGDPDTEIIDGVTWGRPEWIPSAAFWATMLETATEDDGFISRNTTLLEEVGFCLLGGYGITAELNHAFYNLLRDNGVFEPKAQYSALEIETLLRRPTQVDGRPMKYRFPRQKAGRLSAALQTLTQSSPSVGDPLKFRRELMSIPGIGPKTASWITRNWLGSDQVAILDIHVLRAGVLMGLFEHTFKLPRDYEALEKRFLAFCSALDVKASLVDAVMWQVMRNMRFGAI